jgi:hypothetical protein
MKTTKIDDDVLAANTAVATPPDTGPLSQPPAPPVASAKRVRIQRPTYIYRTRQLNPLNEHKQRTAQLVEVLEKCCLRNSFPIMSNMPLVRVSQSVLLLNRSPFALSDPQFGILHHHSPMSMSYL